jgi:hypothetical protein
MSLLAILHEDRNYWLGVEEKSGNRLLKRTAMKNIGKRNGQIVRITKIQRENASK